MFRIDYLSASEAWQPDYNTRSSFEGPFRAGRVHGPAQFVRLLTEGGRAPEGQFFEANKKDGSYWLAEGDFLRMKSFAEAELKQQDQGQFLTSLGTLIGVHLRYQLRDLLAVRRDWTPAFDSYVVLSIPSQKSIIALVGTVKEQPVYSPEFPGAEVAASAGIKLPGGLTQYVINFTFPANAPYLRCVGAPVRF